MSVGICTQEVDTDKLKHFVLGGACINWFTVILY